MDINIDLVVVPSIGPNAVRNECSKKPIKVEEEEKCATSLSQLEPRRPRQRSDQNSTYRIPQTISSTKNTLAVVSFHTSPIGA
jgi:hypothetical protein